MQLRKYKKWAKVLEKDGIKIFQLEYGGRLMRTKLIEYNGKYILKHIYNESNLNSSMEFNSVDELERSLNKLKLPRPQI
jgi:hypothetical protein